MVRLFAAVRRFAPRRLGTGAIGGGLFSTHFFRAFAICANVP